MNAGESIRYQHKDRRHDHRRGTDVKESTAEVAEKANYEGAAGGAHLECGARKCRRPVADSVTHKSNTCHWQGIG